MKITPVNVVTRLVGTPDPGPGARPTWPEGWPPPPEGATVGLPGGGMLRARSVTWYPNGDDQDPNPYVYLVLGPL